MDTNALFNLLSSINIIQPDLQAHLKTVIKQDDAPRKTILLKAGQVAQRIYFIKKGFVRAYQLRNGRQYTSWFMGEGEIIISVYSFYSRKPSFETIETLEDCQLQSVNWDELENIYHKFPQFNINGRIITQQYYIRSEERALLSKTLNPKQQYEKLLADYPGITQKATLGQIASYLGIKQETLSRIRARTT